MAKWKVNMVWPKLKKRNQKHGVFYKQTTRTWFLRGVWDSVDPGLLLVRLGFVISHMVPCPRCHTCSPFSAQLRGGKPQKAQPRAKQRWMLSLLTPNTGSLSNLGNLPLPWSQGWNRIGRDHQKWPFTPQRSSHLDFTRDHICRVSAAHHKPSAILPLTLGLRLYPKSSTELPGDPSDFCNLVMLSKSGRRTGASSFMNMKVPVDFFRVQK